MSCNHTGMHRIAPHMDSTEMARVITGAVGPFMVLLNCMKIIAAESPEGSVAPLNLLLMLDGKGFYDSDIWLLFKDVCERDPRKLMYHIEMELPCQRCGRFDFFFPGFLPNGIKPEGEALQQYLAERRFGEPSSYWALENPPPLVTEFEREKTAILEAEAARPRGVLARLSAWVQG